MQGKSLWNHIERDLPKVGAHKSTRPQFGTLGNSRILGPIMNGFAFLN